MPFSLSLALHAPQLELLIWQISITLSKDQKSQRTKTATETVQAMSISSGNSAVIHQERGANLLCDNASQGKQSWLGVLHYECSGNFPALTVK